MTKMMWLSLYDPSILTDPAPAPLVSRFSTIKCPACGKTWAHPSNIDEGSHRALCPCNHILHITIRRPKQ